MLLQRFTNIMLGYRNIQLTTIVIRTTEKGNFTYSVYEPLNIYLHYKQ